MAWPTKQKRKTKKIVKTLKFLLVLVVGIYLVSHAAGEDLNIKEKINDLKHTDDKEFHGENSGGFDVSFETDDLGDIKEVNIKI